MNNLRWSDFIAERDGRGSSTKAGYWVALVVIIAVIVHDATIGQVRAELIWALGAVAVGTRIGSKAFEPKAGVGENDYYERGRE